LITKITMEKEKSQNKIKTGCNKTISSGLDYEYCGKRDKYGRILLCKDCYNFKEDWDAKWIKN